MIDDAVARRIARRLTDGYGPLRDFAETGAISADLMVALAAMVKSAPEPQGIWIIALDKYCQHRQSKGSVGNGNVVDRDDAA